TLSRGDLLQRTAGRRRAGVVREQCVIAALHELIAMLDEEPARLLAGARVSQPHQHPAAAQPLTGENQLELARCQSLLGSAFTLRLPIAPVPDLHRSAAILSLWDRPLEVAVFQRVILDLDRQTLVRRVERRSAGDRPGLEHSIELEAQIVVQPAGRVLLHHEPQPRGRRYPAIAGW